MSVFNYGGRIGFSTVISLTKKLCKIYITYQSPILSYVNASTLTAPQKATVIGWLNGISEVCGLLLTLEVVYE